MIASGKRHPANLATSNPLTTRREHTRQERQDVSLKHLPREPRTVHPYMEILPSNEWSIKPDIFPCYVCGIYYHGGIIHEMDGYRMPLCFACYGEDDLPNVFLVVIVFLRES